MINNNGHAQSRSIYDNEYIYRMFVCERVAQIQTQLLTPFARIYGKYTQNI